MKYYIVDPDGNVKTTDYPEVANSHSMNDDLVVIDTELNAVVYEGATVEEEIQEAEYLPAVGDDIDADDL